MSVVEGGGIILVQKSNVFSFCLYIFSPPSESDSRWRCGRRVSTILCVHQRRCQPPHCSGHGDCVDGRCRCQEGWQGAACDSLVCQPPACGPHGVCTASKCGGGAQLQQVEVGNKSDLCQWFPTRGTCTLGVVTRGYMDYILYGVAQLI